jgi:hypothetical protein
MTLQKRKPFRSEEYLSWVESLPSCISGQPADDAHHMKGHGMGGTTKAPDWAVIPLTREEHTLFHHLGWETWEAKHGSQWEYVAKTVGMALDSGILKVTNG